MTNLDVEWAKDWMRRSSDTLTEHRMELIDLDRAIGDGDHGENMARGFTAVIQRMDEAPPEDVAGVFKLVAQTLMSKVGGAAGPLYGTAFIRASKAAEGDLDAAWVATLCEAALDGIVTRGKATTGEKTMVDAWTPAITAPRPSSSELSFTPSAARCTVPVETS